MEQKEKSPKRTDPADWEIGTSLSLEAWKNARFDIEDVGRAGIRYIELAWRNDTFDMLDPYNEELCASWVRRTRDLGMDVWTMHLPYGPMWDVSLTDSLQSGEAVQRHLALLQLANRWNIRTAVIHPSWEPIPAEERSARLDACKRNLPVLADAAERLGVRLAVECLPRTCLGNTSLEMSSIMESDERLGVCCDVNHLLQERSEQFIRELGSRIITVHMSDYDGLDEKHWMPGKGIVHWNEVIGTLAAHGYQGPFMFEVREPVPSELTACWNRLLADYRQSLHHG
ncbi:sugar phosphate isomerase/epimerase [Paenibacillus sp. H1-7]|uniref:sugar phosphate isomerase/epimerase family protein n=1 Tax=Paenibacillus sp. H1-7 TaxID=2282849 RepID=UPI001EF7F96F|nr:sugar phosphate isomerase/epimerase family protein [Paenibacillus sp. H1-7]ULL13558.1 sugar phosphate isomerase/epimerase [Paenibacillus sp. H1-7]